MIRAFAFLNSSVFPFVQNNGEKMKQRKRNQKDEPVLTAAS
jgi:hypothetical protein